MTPIRKYNGFPFFPSGIECLILVNVNVPTISPNPIMNVIFGMLVKKIEVRSTPMNDDEEITIFIPLLRRISTGRADVEVCRAIGMKKRNPCNELCLVK